MYLVLRSYIDLWMLKYNTIISYVSEQPLVLQFICIVLVFAQEQTYHFTSTIFLKPKLSRSS